MAEPYIETFRGVYVEYCTYKCAKCQFTWREPTLQNVATSVFVAYANSLYCRKCGADSHSVLIVLQPEPETGQRAVTVKLAGTEDTQGDGT